MFLRFFINCGPSIGRCTTGVLYHRVTLRSTLCGVNYRVTLRSPLCGVNRRVTL